MNHLKLEEITTKISLGLQQIYGSQLEQILLFGSQARGHAKLDSDIDILILLKNQFNYSQESDRISVFIADLCLEYTVVISCIFTTKNKYQEYENGLFRNIRKEGVLI